MIVANIKDAKRYFCMHPSFKDAFAFLETLTADSPEEPFTANNFKGNIFTTETSDVSADGTPKSLEAHREHLDIHYVIKGSEAVGFAHIDTLCPITEYNSDQDYLLLTGELSKVSLFEGDFCIVFPEDAHTPGMYTGKNSSVKKVVVKIRLA